MSAQGGYARSQRNTVRLAECDRCCVESLSHYGITEPVMNDRGASVVRELTEKILVDTRVDPSLIPISDGVIVARKN